MKGWKNCWITWFQRDRTWTAVIVFNRHLGAWVWLENQVWCVYVVPYTTIEAIRAFLSPAKLCAVHKCSRLAPQHLYEELHSLVWKVLQYFNSCLNSKKDTRSIYPFACFLPRVDKYAWILAAVWYGLLGCVPCGVWHAKGKGFGRSF